MVAPLTFADATLHRYEGFRFALYPMQGGHAPEPGDKATLIHLGRALGRLHAVGANGAFVHRPRLDVARHNLLHTGPVNLPCACSTPCAARAPR